MGGAMRNMVIKLWKQAVMGKTINFGICGVINF